MTFVTKMKRSVWWRSKSKELLVSLDHLADQGPGVRRVILITIFVSNRKQKLNILIQTFVDVPSNCALLEGTYSSLCQLCPNKTCEPTSVGPFLDTLQCLIDGGDVALTTSFSVQTFFETHADKLNQFQFLCPDGTTRDMDEVCSWSSQPWRLLVANP